MKEQDYRKLQATQARLSKETGYSITIIAVAEKGGKLDMCGTSNTGSRLPWILRLHASELEQRMHPLPEGVSLPEGIVAPYVEPLHALICAPCRDTPEGKPISVGIFVAEGGPHLNRSFLMSPGEARELAEDLAKAADEVETAVRSDADAMLRGAGQ